MAQQKPPDLDEFGNPITEQPPDLDESGKPITPVKTAAAKPAPTTETKPKKSFGDIPWYLRALAGPTDPMSVFKRVMNPIIERNLETIVPQLSGEKPGVLNPNLEENPLLLKSFLPETEVSRPAPNLTQLATGEQPEPTLTAKFRHGLYENLIRPMASPLGIYSMFLDPPTESTAQQLRAIGRQPKIRAIGRQVAKQGDEAVDPNFAGGAGDPELAGSVPYKPLPIRGLKERHEELQKISYGRDLLPEEELEFRKLHKKLYNEDVFKDELSRLGEESLTRELTPEEKARWKYLQRNIKEFKDITTDPFDETVVNTFGTELPKDVQPFANIRPGEGAVAQESPFLTAPTGAGIPKFGSRSKNYSQYIEGEPKVSTGPLDPSNVKPFDPSTLVGMTKAQGKTPPSKAPRFKINKDRTITDRETGETISFEELYQQGKVQTKPGHATDIDVRRGWGTEIANLPRAIQSSYDISFPFRQGLGLIHTKGWWTSWDDMFKALGSEKSFRAVMDSIYEKPNFRKVLINGKWKKSFAEDAGLEITDLVSKREEHMLSSIAEKIPGIRASNRAYVAFANKLRSDVFDSLIEQAEKQGLKPRQNLVLARQIAAFVNNASGRGSLGALEKNADQLAAMFFSPKLIASRVQMLNQTLNPMTYRMTPAFIKKQYWKSVLGIASAWTTLATVAKMSGAEVNLDPDSTDFGKIKIGNTRLDIGGGFQQYLVLAHRLMSGKYKSSVSNKTTEYGSRYGVNSRLDAITEFIQNKLAPVPGTAAASLGASRYRPFAVGDEAIRLMTPMIIQDISEILQEDPNLLPVIGAAAVGAGVQSYGERGRGHRLLPESVFPKEKDIQFKGGKFF